MTRMVTKLSAALLFYALCLPSAVAVELRDLLEKAKQSTVYLLIPAEDPQTGVRLVRTASGFIVSKTGRVVTAQHVLREWIAQGDAQKARNRIKARIGSIHAAALELELLDDDTNADFAILRIRKDGQYAAVDLCGVGTKPPGDVITVIGFPLGQEFNHAQGTIANSDAPGGRWTTNTSMDEGMSGGPVFDNNGRVIGIVKGGLEVEIKGTDRPSATIRYVTPLIRATAQLMNNEVKLEGCAELEIKQTGLTNKEVADLVQRQKQQESDVASQKKIAELSQELGVTKEALSGFFKTIGEESGSPGSVVERLAKLAEQFRDARDRAVVLRGEDDPYIKSLLSQAHEAISKGHYDYSDLLLAEAEEAELTAIRKLDAARETRLLNAAAERADRGRVALVQSRNLVAADHFRAARERVPPSYPDVRDDYRNAEADALYEEGNRTGNPEALKREIGLHREHIQDTSRTIAPLDKAMTREKLGTALRLLGGQEEDIERLKEAVAIQRIALQEVTALRAPHSRAHVLNSLAISLFWLGQRETGTKHLKEAVADFRESLQEHTRERHPLNWAVTHGNLCHALGHLGRRESSKTRLLEAMATCRLALEVATRDKTPTQWSNVTITLGEALWYLGEQETGTDRLREAVNAFKEGLVVVEGEGRSRVAISAKKRLAEVERLIAKRTASPALPAKK